MAIQFNYFAIESDVALIAEAVFQWHKSIAIIHQLLNDPTPTISTTNQPTEFTRALVGEIVYVADAEQVGNFKSRQVVNGTVKLQCDFNPIVELFPSGLADDGVPTIGRFYAKFNDPEFKNDVQKLFKLLKTQANKIDTGLWIFPAATKQPFLRPWGGKDWENPLVK